MPSSMAGRALPARLSKCLLVQPWRRGRKKPTQSRRRGFQFPMRTGCDFLSSRRRKWSLSSKDWILQAPSLKATTARQTCFWSSPAAVRAGKSAPRLWRKCPARRVNRRWARARFVPTGNFWTSWLRKVAVRYTGEGMVGLGTLRWYFVVPCFRHADSTQQGNRSYRKVEFKMMPCITNGFQLIMQPAH